MIHLWDEFKGSLSGQFYKNILTKPIKNAWVYFFVLVAIVSVLFTFKMAMTFTRTYGEMTSFLQESFPIVEFSGGKISNMPESRLEKKFDGWSIRVDSIYLDSISAQSDTSGNPDQKPCLYIGPHKSFLIKGGVTTAFEYPSTMTKTIKAEELQKARVYIYPLSFIIIMILNMLWNTFISIIYVMIIALILVFKYRAQAISFGQGVHAGLYLVTIQILLSLFFRLIGVSIPYSFLWYILFYIIYVGVFVNLEFIKNINQPASAN